MYSANRHETAAADAKNSAGASLLAQVIVSIIADHVPLHRQGKIFSRCGVANCIRYRFGMWTWLLNRRWRPQAKPRIETAWNPFKLSGISEHVYIAPR